MADFKLGFSLDTSDLEKGKKALHDVASAAGQLANTEGKRKQAHDAADAALGKTINTSKQAEASAQRYIQSIKMEDQALKAFEQSQKTLNKALEQGKLNAQQHAAYIKQVGQAYADAKKQAEAFRSAQPQGPGAGSGFAGALERIRGIGGQAGNLGSILSGNAGVGGAMEGVAGMATRLGTALGPVGVGLAGVAAAGAAAGLAFKHLLIPLAEVQDKFASYKGQIDLVLDSTMATEKMMKRVIASANQTGVAIDTAMTAFTRILRNSEDIGATADEVAQLTELVQKLGIVSRTGQGEMQGAMIQLSQALAAGRLNGDELRSIMENMPALAKAIADGLGVSVGQLRRMGAEGELTSAKVFQGLLSQTDAVNKEFEKMPQTSAQAFARLDNQWQLFKNNMATGMDASGQVQAFLGPWISALEKLNEWMDEDSAEKVQRLGREIQMQRDLLAKGLYGPEGQQMVRERIALLEQERAAIEAAANVEKGREKNRAKEEADNKRDATIKQAFEALKNAGYDKETNERKRLNTLIDDGTKGLAEAIKKRDELKQKSLDASAAEVKAYWAATQAIITMQKALATGNPFTIAQARAGLEQANANRFATLKEAALQKTEYDAAEDQVNGFERMIAEARKDLAGVGKKKTGGGGSKAKPAIETLRETLADLRAATGQEQGGGIDLLLQSLRANREAKGTGAETLKLATEQAALQAQRQIADLRRQTEQQNELTRAIGKTGPEIREIEIRQAAANFQYEKFGKQTGPEVTKAVQAYTNALRDQKEAADRAAAAQAVLDARLKATQAWQMAAATGDPREQARLQFEASLEKELNDFRGTPAQKADLERERRSEFLAKEAGQQIAISDAQQKQLKSAQDRLRIAGLSTGEYEIQLRLLEKAAELEGRGYRKGEKFYDDTMAREESNARREQVIVSEEQRKRNFIRQWEGAADDVGLLMSNSLDDAFKNGLKSAGTMFKDGMGKIFNDLGNQLLYEFAVRPVQELMRQLMQMAAQKIFMNLLSGALPGGASQGPTMSMNMIGLPASRNAAHGAAFALGGLTAFARGGAFTNSIVSSPTLFAFAGGTGLMGEAGPEAIMPLKRGANGKLGVEGGGGGDTTIIINDMRSSANSEPVKTQERRGPDGKRMISVLIRDEVRRQIRSGDLDRDMQASYGATRQLARK